MNFNMTHFDVVLKLIPFRKEWNEHWPINKIQNPNIEREKNKNDQPRSENKRIECGEKEQEK